MSTLVAAPKTAPDDNDLDAACTQGLLHLPGSTHATRALVRSLLRADRDAHHCFYGKVGFHNHLPHHILAAYDLGAPPRVLQDAYDEEAKVQYPIDLVDRATQTVGSPGVVVTAENWTEHLGPEKNYAPYLEFFTAEVRARGVQAALEEYIFSPRANGNGNDMLLRTVGGALHPIIQIGYGVEFNMPSIVASGLAEAAVTRSVPPALFEDSAEPPAESVSLLEIIRKMYDSDVLKPIMPYQPDALLSTRMKEALTDDRAREIRRLSAQWHVDASLSPAEFEKRTEEALWVATLLLAGTGKRGRAPRLDFFLMHVLTSSLFLGPLVRAIRAPEDRARLLRVFVPVVLLIILVRGRPRIDCALVMGYTAVPRPPSAQKDDDGAALTNPWPAILDDAVRAPDAHTVKVVRTLFYAAQRCGETPPGGAPGAFGAGGKETLEGAGELDGTLFVRAAGVVMDTLGWVTHGQKEGKWDRSALGWDAAWEGGD
ncbi:hypothetical protein M0805_005020 [Coniferiporia weirii]|nr:hypothetical protein M0805_005020 [Coniferiporia weirii]